ncbi:MAG: DUF2231 domain-containing protein [Brevundimonas sp.]
MPSFLKAPTSVREVVTAGGPHPVHAILLAFPIALFTGAVVSDIAYLRTAEVQWTNFSSWLIAGGVLFTGLTLAWALVALAAGWRGQERRPRAIYAALLALLFVVGLVNALKHSQDAWSSVQAFGLTLSILSALLALIAGVLAFWAAGAREVVR